MNASTSGPRATITFTALSSSVAGSARAASSRGRTGPRPRRPAVRGTTVQPHQPRPVGEIIKTEAKPEAWRLGGRIGIHRCGQTVLCRCEPCCAAPRRRVKDRFTQGGESPRSAPAPALSWRACPHGYQQGLGAAFPSALWPG